MMEIKVEAFCKSIAKNIVAFTFWVCKELSTTLDGATLLYSIYHASNNGVIVSSAISPRPSLLTIHGSKQ